MIYFQNYVISCLAQNYISVSPKWRLGSKNTCFQPLESYMCIFRKYLQLFLCISFPPTYVYVFRVPTTRWCPQSDQMCIFVWNWWYFQNIEKFTFLAQMSINEHTLSINKLKKCMSCSPVLKYVYCQNLSVSDKYIDDIMPINCDFPVRM